MRLPQVVIYSKEGCCLCHEAKAVFDRLLNEIPFTIKEVDITGIPDLLERYGQEVPVVFIEGRKAFKFRVDEKVARKRLLRALKEVEP